MALCLYLCCLSAIEVVVNLGSVVFSIVAEALYNTVSRYCFMFRT